MPQVDFQFPLQQVVRRVATAGLGTEYVVTKRWYAEEPGIEPRKYYQIEQSSNESNVMETEESEIQIIGGGGA